MTIEKKIFNILIWFLAALALLILFTSCNPYTSLYPSASSATETAQIVQTARPTEELPTYIPSPTPLTCTVQTGVPAGFLNLRAGAGIQYAVIRVLHEGEVLTVLERGAWLQVIDAQDNHGFINSRYCR